MAAPEAALLHRSMWQRFSAAMSRAAPAAVEAGKEARIAARTSMPQVGRRAGAGSRSGPNLQSPCVHDGLAAAFRTRAVGAAPPGSSNSLADACLPSLRCPRFAAAGGDTRLRAWGQAAQAPAGGEREAAPQTDWHMCIGRGKPLEPWAWYCSGQAASGASTTARCSRSPPRRRKPFVHPLPAPALLPQLVAGRQLAAPAVERGQQRCAGGRAGAGQERQRAHLPAEPALRLLLPRPGAARGARRQPHLLGRCARLPVLVRVGLPPADMQCRWWPGPPPPTPMRAAASTRSLACLTKPGLIYLAPPVSPPPQASLPSGWAPRWMCCPTTDPWPPAR